MDKPLEGEELLIVSPKGIDSITFEEAARRMAAILAGQPATQPEPVDQNPPPKTGEWVPDEPPTVPDKPAETPPAEPAPAPPVLGERFPDSNLKEHDDEGTPVTQ